MAALPDATMPAELPAPVLSISLRTWPLDFPDDIAVQRRAPYEARADAIMYRQELAELAQKVAAETVEPIKANASKFYKPAA